MIQFARQPLIGLIEKLQENIIVSERQTVLERKRKGDLNRYINRDTREKERKQKKERKKVKNERKK